MSRTVSHGRAAIDVGEGSDFNELGLSRKPSRWRARESRAWTRPTMSVSQSGRAQASSHWLSAFDVGRKAAGTSAWHPYARCIPGTRKIWRWSFAVGRQTRARDKAHANDEPHHVLGGQPATMHKTRFRSPPARRRSHAGRSLRL